ncbi:tetratricopeptide repeat protein [Sphingorhabdus sp.]|uniref:tetratricopeptide repeat protein n=1 Tax=Sphingorhabdus sp. TaxID=1902408 RepID=UPI003918F9A7
MKHYGYGLLLLLSTAPVLAAQPADSPLNAPTLYLQQVDKAIREGRLTQAEQMIGLLEQLGPGAFADDLALLKAEHAIARMDVASAGTALAGIRNLERNVCRVYAAKGWVAANQQALDEAIVALAKATTDCPDDAGAWNLLGLAFIGKGETSAAKEAFEQALALEPDNAHVINNHALAILQDGAVDAALRQLDRAVTRSPQDGMIRTNRNFVAGMAGLSPERAQNENDADWSAKLVQFARGAKAAALGIQATALFSRAILTLDRFDETIWTELNPTVENPR